MKQETRQWVIAALFYGSWAVAIILTFLRVTERLGQQWGALIILFMGVAIAAAVRLSRMRLTETMIQVYRAGVETARVQSEERDEMEQRIMNAHAAAREEVVSAVQEEEAK
jgi:hypothetical protein